MTDTLLQQIREKFKNSNTQINIRKLPAYLSCFLKENRDVIFIHNVNNAKLEKFSYKSLQNNQTINNEIFDGDITGQPLEAPHSEFDSLNLSNTFELFIEDSEAHHHFPLSLLEARTILCHCALIVKPSFPVFILTDSNDLKKTVILSNEVNGGWITRSWVTNQGFLASEPTLESLQHKHAQFSGSPPHMATCEAECMYVIKKGMLLDDPSLVHSSLTLNASWTKMSLEPPLMHRSTEIRLNTKVRIGHEEGGLKVLWEEICLLDSYLNLLSQIRSDNCSVPIMSLPSLTESMKKNQCRDPPLSRVSMILAEPVNSCLGSDCSQPNLDQLIKLYALAKESMTSVTDRIWTLFIECKTYQELSGCFKELFMVIKKKTAPAPFLSSSNITRLGRALLGKDGIGVYDPIENLVELGIEKLKKEMLLIFSKTRIATGNSLNVPKFPNFSEVSSMDWLSTARKWHLWLCQAHCALEVFWNIQESLRLSNEALYSIAPNILQFFTGKNSKIDSFATLIESPLLEVETNIPVKYVESRITTMSTEEMVFTLFTSTGVKKCQSTFYKTPQNCFPNVFNNNVVEEDDTMPLNSLIYHWYEYKSISELFSKAA